MIVTVAGTGAKYNQVIREAEKFVKGPGAVLLYGAEVKKKASCPALNVFTTE